MCPTVKLLFTNDSNVDDKGVEKGAVNVKDNCHNRAKKVVWCKASFEHLKDCTGDEADKGVGKHSIQKSGSTRAGWTWWSHGSSSRVWGPMGWREGEAHC